MAKVDNNIITSGLTGKIGNLVFRRRGKKTTAYILSATKVKTTKKQEEARLRFAEAIILACNALKDEKEKKKFKKLAKKEGKESAYSAAVAYFMKN